MKTQRMCESTEINFHKLEDRLLSINDPIYNKASSFQNMLWELANAGTPTLIMATGGSKIVGYYLQFVLERLTEKGILCEVIEPRDYYYKHNKNQFGNLIVVSASGKSNGIEEALNSFNGHKYLICEHECDASYEIVSWGNKLYDHERSFISLASTLGPITLMLDAVNKDDIRKRVVEVNNMLFKLLNMSRKKIESLGFDFSDQNLIQIMSGYDTRVSSYALESNLVESGVASVVIHDKGAFCHGRSNLLFKYPSSAMIYLEHRTTPLDDTLKEVLSSNYDNILSFNGGNLDDEYFEEFYLLLQMYFLSKRIAEDRKIDLTMPEYNRDVIKKVYSYRGVM